MVDQDKIAEKLESKAPKMQWKLAGNIQFQGAKSFEEIGEDCPECGNPIVCCHVLQTLPNEYANRFCHLCSGENCGFVRYTEYSTLEAPYQNCPFCGRKV